MFDGKTYSHELDQERLGTLFERVFDYMSDHNWHTLTEIQKSCGGTESSVSARLRDFRKEKFGSHQVDRRRRGKGLWEYRLVS